MREDVLVEWNPWWEEEFELEFVDRNILERIKKWIGRREVIALTGARRSGKTTLMYIIIKNLLDESTPENILFVKCDDERVEEPIIEGAIEKHTELFNPKGRRFLFLDEVQNAKDWDKTVKRIYDLHENIKVCLSGSRILKNKISASLAGRSAYFSIFPFSFGEFLRSKELKVETKIDALAKKRDIKYYLRRYLEFGAF
ncbi:MAG: AAA family ATPase, partial [Candidatus Korarchaeota archaeon]|nr:AAA family ATPase [Candidatus Korarchaeota archaeon]NIU84091.1 AAA family ATPase [Candidatus Thorarchaeota archaeon]NIW14235.1 AAA family ATPase [Candidatus Thorarchaeota archaeon]NIW52327.1 AAA family ATPase [Candidatus Korarchaeota archaeon]